MALTMVIVHFGKLLYETVRLHRYSGRMISLRKVFWEEAFNYWFILGACVGFTVHHTEYHPWTVFADLDFGIRNGNLFKILVMGIFVTAEYMNFKCKEHFV